MHCPKVVSGKMGHDCPLKGKKQAADAGGGREWPSGYYLIALNVGLTPVQQDLLDGAGTARHRPASRDTQPDT